MNISISGRSKSINIFRDKTLRKYAVCDCKSVLGLKYVFTFSEMSKKGGIKIYFTSPPLSSSLSLSLSRRSPSPVSRQYMYFHAKNIVMILNKVTKFSRNVLFEDFKNEKCTLGMHIRRVGKKEIEKMRMKICMEKLCIFGGNEM